MKGGTLVTALVGVSMRTTMDIDATVRGIALQEDEIARVVGEICATETGDGMTFHMKSTDRIMDEHDYRESGCRWRPSSTAPESP